MTALRASKSASNWQQKIADLAARREVHAAFAWFHRHQRQLEDWQMEIAAIPAPPFGEARRSEWLSRRFAELQLDQVHSDELGNVFGALRRENKKEFLAVSAHIDTVFPAGTTIDIRRNGDRLQGPGIGDNAAGVTAMLALIAAMSDAQLQPAGSVLFIGNVGEEGEGDLRGMRHIYAQPGWRESIARALVIDGAGVDTIVTQALGSRRFEITMRGPGGHSWSDASLPNPIAALAHALSNFYETPAAAEPKKSAYNVGVISGGTSVNSIPQSAAARVDIRATTGDEAERLAAALKTAVEVAQKHMSPNGKGKKLTAEIKQIGNRPAGELPTDAPILQIVKAVDAHLGIRSHPHLASTDANLPLSLGIEAVSLGAGGTGGGAHTLEEWYDPKGRELALKRLLLVVLALAGEEMFSPRMNAD